MTDHSPWKDAEQAVIAKLDIAAEYRALGVVFTQDHPRDDGWQPCHSVASDDTDSLAEVCIKGPGRGRYRDRRGFGTRLNLWQFAVKVRRCLDWREARQHYADQAGIELPSGEEPKRPEDQLDFNSNTSNFVLHNWSELKGGFDVRAVLDNGGCAARYPKKAKAELSQYVLAFPVFGGPDFLDYDPCGWVVANQTGEKMVLYQGKDKPVIRSKTLSVGGSVGGLMGMFALERLAEEKAGGPPVEVVWKVEGLTDLLAVTTAIQEGGYQGRHVAISNSGGTTENVKPEWVDLLRGKVVYVLHDCDVPGRTGAYGWANALAGKAAEVRCVLLPFPVTKNHGADVRDYLMGDMATYGQLLEMAQQAMPVTSDQPTALAELARAMNEGLPAGETAGQPAQPGLFDGARGEDGASTDPVAGTVEARVHSNTENHTRVKKTKATSKADADNKADGRVGQIVARTHDANQAHSDDLITYIDLSTRPKGTATNEALKAIMSDILERLDIEAEYRTHIPFLRITSDRPTHRGWLQCYALGRKESTASAGFCIGNGTERGRYRDHALDSGSFWDVMIRYGGFPTFMEALRHFARKANVKLPTDATEVSPEHRCPLCDGTSHCSWRADGLHLCYASTPEDKIEGWVCLGKSKVNRRMWLWRRRDTASMKTALKLAGPTETVPAIDTFDDLYTTAGVVNTPEAGTVGDVTGAVAEPVSEQPDLNGTEQESVRSNCSPNATHDEPNVRVSLILNTNTNTYRPSGDGTHKTKSDTLSAAQTDFSTGPAHFADGGHPCPARLKVILRDKTDYHDHLAGELRCRRWTCVSCINWNKARWTAALSTQLRSLGATFVWRGNERHWTAVAKRISRAKGEYCRIETGCGELLVVASVAFTGAIQMGRDTAIKTVRAAIEAIPWRKQAAGTANRVRPVSASQHWSVREVKANKYKMVTTTPNAKRAAEILEEAGYTVDPCSLRQSGTWQQQFHCRAPEKDDLRDVHFTVTWAASNIRPLLDDDGRLMDPFDLPEELRRGDLGETSEADCSMQPSSPAVTALVPKPFQSQQQWFDFAKIRAVQLDSAGRWRITESTSDGVVCRWSRCAYHTHAAAEQTLARGRFQFAPAGVDAQKVNYASEPADDAIPDSDAITIGPGQGESQ